MEDDVALFLNVELAFIWEGGELHFHMVYDSSYMLDLIF